MPNSPEDMYRPDELQQRFGIGKDAYYEDVKFLRLKAHRDEENRVYLDQSQYMMLAKLRQHVEETGRREGFSWQPPNQSDDATEQAGDLDLVNGNHPVTGLVEVDDFASATQETETIPDQLIQGASALKAHHITLPQQTVLTLAQQMTYDDLLEEDKAKVDTIRQACSPKGQAASIASQILEKHRRGKQPVQQQISS